MSIHEFPAIPILSSGGTSTVTLGINFNDTTQNAKFDITLTEEDGGKRCHGVSIGKNSIVLILERQGSKKFNWIVQSPKLIYIHCLIKI